MKKILSVGLITLSLMSAANANERSFMPYIGLEGGASSISSDYAVWDDSSFAVFKGNLGFRYGKYIGAEVSYEFSLENEVTVNYPGFSEKDTGKYSSYGADVIGYLPLSKSFDLIGSIGIAKYTFDVDWNDSFGDSGSGSDHKTAARLGIGAQYNLNKNVGFTLMTRYSPVKIDDEDGEAYINGIFNVSLGAKFSF